MRRVLTVAYQLEGRLLEVCTCNILCPCWVGEDPDNGTCEAIASWHIDSGTIDGVDVSGCNFIVLGDIPGNVLAGNWKVAVFLDADISDAQQEAMLNVWTGKLGGPVADLASLIGEVVSVERAPIKYEIVEGKGTITIGDVAEATMEPYRGPSGEVTTLNESVFSTIPGSPAWVAKASSYSRKGAKYGLADLDIQGHNAIQGLFKFEG
jgi:hypothetical protein